MNSALPKLAAIGLALATLGGAAAWAIHEQNKVCCAIPPIPDHPHGELGLMTSLPLYWPLGADLAALMDGNGERPWTRDVLEGRYDLRLLDTLSSVEEPGSGDRQFYPLEGLTQLAVIQPRGLSPADNVALDEWVRGGGRLLIALDPALTGEYELPLGDPRRPVATALIPPVIERWGLSISFDDAQEFVPRAISVGGVETGLLLPGELRAEGEAGQSCLIAGGGTIARCEVGDGRVTVLADAAIFEHPELAGEDGRAIHAVFDFAF